MDTTALAERLAQEIRRVDGSHSLGAAALAEALVPFVESLRAAPAAPGAAVRVDESMVDSVRADIMQNAANDGCPIVIKDAWVRAALTTALAGKESA